MKRHDDSQRSGRLAVPATSQPPVAATLTGGRNGRSPRLTWSGEPVTIGSFGIERMVMRRDGDSERSDRLVTRATSTVCTAGRGKVHEARIAVDVSCAGPHTSSSRFNGSVMKRHDDSQRGDRLAVTFGDPDESLTARGPYANVPRLGFDGSVMKRHDDRQRSDGLAVAATLAGGRKRRSPRLISLGDRETIGSSGIERMRMMRHDDSQRIDRLVVTQPMLPTPPPPPPTFSNRETTNRSG